MTQDPTSIEKWLVDTTLYLRNAKIDTARLDALVLLCDEINQEKSWVLAHPEHILQRSEIKKLSKKIVQRAQHKPLAYLRGRCEFYGRNFAVDGSVLVPRPETESMVMLLNRLLPKHESAHVYDIGTGSGCLAVTTKLEFPAVHVVATDISRKALRLAKRNAKSLDADVDFMHGNLLEPLKGMRRDTENLFILANLPYVPDNYDVNKAASFEPTLALFSGPDGLNHYRKLFAQLPLLGSKPSAVITESLPEQQEHLKQIATQSGYCLQAVDGLASLFALYV